MKYRACEIKCNCANGSPSLSHFSESVALMSNDANMGLANWLNGLAFQSKYANIEVLILQKTLLQADVSFGTIVEMLKLFAGKSVVVISTKKKTLKSSI